MSYIQVTSSELRNRASELSALNMRYQGEIENIQNCQTGLNTMWEGDAKDAFNAAFTKSRAVLDTFKSAVDMYIEALNIIAQKYEEAEKKNIAIAGMR